jgi:hypothetical protein
MNKENQFDVYYNLHKHLFSLKARYDGLVKNHANEVFMENVQFKVSQAGRKRVLKEKRKNVHAFVRGELVRHFSPYGYLDIDKDFVVHNGTELTYNPYKYSTFVIKETGEPVYEAKKVVLIGRKIFALSTK